MNNDFDEAPNIATLANLELDLGAMVYKQYMKAKKASNDQLPLDTFSLRPEWVPHVRAFFRYSHRYQSTVKVNNKKFSNNFTSQILDE